MTDQSSSAKKNKKGRLRKAKSLDAKSQPVQPISAVPPQMTPVPPAPIPASGDPPQTVPPAPIPVGAAVPDVADSVPPAPIPVGGDTSQAVPPAPIPVGPSEEVPVVSEPGAGGPPVEKPSAPGTATGTTAPRPGDKKTASSGAKAQPILLTEEQKVKQIVSAQKWERGRKAVGVREELEAQQEQGAMALLWRDFAENNTSFAVSAAVHFVILVILGVLTLSMPNRQIELVATPDLPEELDIEELENIELEPMEIEKICEDIVDRLEPESLQPMVDMENAAEGIDAASTELSDIGLEQAPYNDLLSEIGRGTGAPDARGTGKGNKGTGAGLNGTGRGMGGRGGRRGKAIDRGASKESEAAVDLALQWLAAHQFPDGGWSFNHCLAPSCHGQCRNPGKLPEARIAATALGVLPFLGAGQTHQVGKYRKTVTAGLNYLINRLQVGPHGGCLTENGGRMYAHGLATIALCEAYAMSFNPDDERKRQVASYDGTGEPSPSEAPLSLRQKQLARKDRTATRGQIAALARASQLALNYVAYAQDPVGGGWRYQPRQAGDTSVVGWQMMALVSGRMAYLAVDPRTLKAGGKFLDTVQSDSGANYGYTGSDRGSSATQAIGLLCRMYLGWKRDHTALEHGAQALGARGPSRGNMYYNYYATQVMHHFGGDPWKQWNVRMRDSLVNSQAKAGHEAGSWHFGGGDHGAERGGRLYCTALAAMTLEVYYRHMPLYGKDVFEAPQPEKNKGPKKADDF